FLRLPGDPVADQPIGEDTAIFLQAIPQLVRRELERLWKVDPTGLRHGSYKGRFRVSYRIPDGEAAIDLRIDQEGRSLRRSRKRGRRKWGSPRLPLELVGADELRARYFKLHRGFPAHIWVRPGRGACPGTGQAPPCDV